MSPAFFLFFPFPSGNFRQVHTILVDILFVFNKLVAHSLIEIGASVAEHRQILESLLYQVETIYLVLYTYIERCGDRAFFLVTADVDVAVIMTAVNEFVYQYYRFRTGLCPLAKCRYCAKCIFA